jgi:alpha-1,3-rhamnosyl/mannosyltransferase
LTGLPFFDQHKIDFIADVFHATDHFIPKLKNTPVIATLMDAIPLSHPHWVNKR